MLTVELLGAIAVSANLAPSVHNTQPARWLRDGTDAILVAGDLSRHLEAGDPIFRDMGVSCGAAVEGTVLALAEHGFGVAEIEDLWASGDTVSIPGHRLAARIVLKGDGEASVLGRSAAVRFTWRSFFKPAPVSAMQALASWAAAMDDVALALSPTDIDMLASLGDEAAMPFLRDTVFRKELVSWMRFSPTDPRYGADGMNLQAMQMGSLEGKGARLLLGTSLFSALDAVGIAKMLTGEKAKTKSSSAIALFHRASEETPVASGRAFYRMWLNMTRLGFTAWPMAAAADNKVSAELCAQRFGIPDDRRLINVLRLGVPSGPMPARARLAPSNLIVA
jgi:nitroreductase